MKEQLISQFKEVFGRVPTVLARAPGRIEFIGNHTDYNGGTVLGASIDRSIWVAVAPREDGWRQFHSSIAGKVFSQSAASMQRQEGVMSWVNYPLGILDGMPAFGCTAPAGFDYMVSSDLPTGAGLSSSAAIELASGLAFLALSGQSLDTEQLVKLGRHAENNYVGVPCGILDQGVSGFGEQNRLVFIDCRGPTFSTVPLPATAHFWVFNTHTKHALVDGLYAARHRECMEAAQALGVAILADASASALDHPPAGLSENAAKRARHVVNEIGRVAGTVAALEQGDLEGVGRLLTQSHRSSEILFENSTPELDCLVDLLTETPHVFGARLTGGGFGGAVMALTDAEFGETEAEQVAAVYLERYGERPNILHMQTGPGAALVEI